MGRLRRGTVVGLSAAVAAAIGAIGLAVPPAPSRAAAAAPVGAAQAGDAAKRFAARCAEVAAKVAGADAAVWRAPDGRLIAGGDLRHYGAGPFHGADAAKAARSPRNQDPLPAIADFHRQVKAAGAVLIVVPVPSPAAVWADLLDGGPETVKPDGPRPDAAQVAFLAALAAEGVAAVDLLPVFRRLRADGTDPHCRTDSHWSPAAVEAVAGLLADRVKKLPGFPAPAPAPKAALAPAEVPISGDLAALSAWPASDAKSDPAAKPAGERFRIRRVTLDGKPVAPDPASPVVLMGDSHTLVWHEAITGGIDCAGAGLADHLAAGLGTAPDLVGALGGGANASRITLARRRDNLAGKRVVIWVFAMRELTESQQGWAPLPVVRAAAK